ncbi:MAG: FAD-dependent oxidoreductase [Gammaproteobacteria bacterium]|nr:FAD-dependent oxidoreductase [Gammaproteobacteria bacterium]
MSPTPELRLQGFDYKHLFYSEGLARLDETFLDFLGERDQPLKNHLLAYRQNHAFTKIEISELLIASAALLEDFLGQLFQIEEQVAIAQARTIAHNPISAFKKYYVLRRARKSLNQVESYPTFETLTLWLDEHLQKAALKAADRELSIALLGMQFLNNPDVYADEIEMLVKWCVRVMTSPEGTTILTTFRLFQQPARLDYQNLVPTHLIDAERRSVAPEALRLRDGFALTDPRMNAREVQDEVNYCIYCHDHEGDFCSIGFPNKKSDPSLGFKKNPLDVTLIGCPLEEKISEMHTLKKDGLALASLAMVMVDNPMCPATGHRICNECMKACIYQKQEPVNIPQIETRVLTDVLDLPWGVEIYDLLTRWNPLRQHQWVMKPFNGLKVMIAGMGPAGFTLAHHLLLEGFAVVGFDGLKIEPLPEAYLTQPIYRFDDLKEALDERLMSGFGGVAEYGITVRWDKNFLKLIYVSLLRKPYFQVFGGVRFGGTITVDDAWDLGFDHLAVAVGAGLPKALPIPGSMAPGMRQANDFLMALQLGNAAKDDSLNNLQMRLPAVVIGGGLTGVDTATELQAYYIVQVEKTLERFETLVQTYGQDYVHATLDAASQAILSEYLNHGLAIRAERERAKGANELPNFIQLIRRWGGVSIAYRRSMQESPAYINNHEELKKALEEGIYYLEGVEPSAVELDEFGHAATLICQKRIRNEDLRWVATEEEIKLPARSILVATGTQPNIAYEFEHRGTFNRMNLQYQHYEEDEEGTLASAPGVQHCKDPFFGAFTSYQKKDKRVSLIGDTHPVFHGSVVKAIASGMRTYPKIVRTLQDRCRDKVDEAIYQQFSQTMKELFLAKLVTVTRKSQDTLELIIKAPLAARHFKAGEFYRLQNYETYATKVGATLLQLEPLALIAADCDKKKGLLTFVVKETNATTKICATLKPGEPVSLMGPTGVRAKVPAVRETILIVGDHFSLSFIRAYGAELRTHQNRVIYLATYQDQDDIYSQTDLEDVTDLIIWLTQKGNPFTANRPQDIVYHALTPLEGLIKYHQENNSIPLADVDRIHIVGNTDLLRMFQSSQQMLCNDYFIKNPKIYGSVYGNMQCMLKGVCAQCLQWQIDPETGQRTKAVFACSWQDQPLEIVDINHIDERQTQNRLLEKLTTLWVDYLFDHYQVARI